ncbi:Glycine cleavage system transcriptional activator [Kushneria phyllosphaerae]|uniref:Glycine cleavage system transcriptional activator n=2 Tax=Kushneria phyllosphaerae TaxID=2100822 RepID=A0A2R8CI89_9GAMM|nr:Glycine cleavage system transcriptional activator [Kushneria phyllosphaerae]
MPFPSLSALRAFEAAARLGSFKTAAAELNLSSTAISHHVRKLEEQLDTALFVRASRQVQLTESGHRLSVSATQAFAGLHATLDELQQGARQLTVSTTPAFASLWLAPRLDDFRQDFPGTDIRILSSSQRTDLNRDRRIDIALRYGPAEMMGPDAEQLSQESMGAFASPSLATRLASLQEAELIATRWESDSLAPIEWASWLESAGESIEAAQRALSFAHEQEVVQAGLAGKGVILVSELLVRSMVEYNWLVPWQPEISVKGYAYHAVRNPWSGKQPMIEAFITWLRCEMSGSP